MARFPFKQAEVMVLAEQILNGLRDNQDIYPAPWVALADFEAAIARCHQAADKLEKAKTAKSAATVKHRQAFAVMQKSLKSQLRYAECIVDFDDEKLKQIGWGGRKERTPKAKPPTEPEDNAAAKTDNG